MALDMKRAPQAPPSWTMRFKKARWLLRSDHILLGLGLFTALFANWYWVA